MTTSSACRGPTYPTIPHMGSTARPAGGGRRSAATSGGCKNPRTVITGAPEPGTPATLTEPGVVAVPRAGPGTWAGLATETESPLTAEEINRLRGLGDALDLDEVREVYLPLSRLLSLRVEAAEPAAPRAGGLPAPADAAAHPVRDRARRLGRGRQVDRRPGVLQQMLAHWPEHPNVALVTTDGFLYPNAELERRGLLERKGFPESYDRRALLKFVVDIKSGRDEVEAPVYSHLVYDVVPDEKVVIKSPTSSSSRASTCSSPPGSARTAAPAWPSPTSSTSRVYVDAATNHIRRLVHLPLPAAARDRVPRPAVLLRQVRRALPRRGGRRGAADLGRHQRPEPGAERAAHPLPGRRWCCARTPTTRSATCGCASYSASRARTTPASDSATLCACSAVGASTITRTSGSVPDGRKQHPAGVAQRRPRPQRPLPPARRRRTASGPRPGR